MDRRVMTGFVQRTTHCGPHSLASVQGMVQRIQGRLSRKSWPLQAGVDRFSEEMARYP
jgi:hypothetical protein